MNDFLLQVGVSNLLISFGLALLAWTVQSTGKRPFVAHLLWLLVLVKLVTPPIFNLPVVAIPWLSASAAEVPALEAWEGGAAAVQAGAVDLPVDTAAMSIDAVTALALLWMLGSVLVLAWSLVRVFRFNRLLGMASEAAPPEVQRLAVEFSRRLALKQVPLVVTTRAEVPPMVWWIGGRVRIVIPASLTREMDAQELRWILAHELAHVRRRDHMVRWLEWLACVCFWWNPVAWWARRNLRANEEVCCDALVLSSLKPNPQTYANSLLNAVEFLAFPALRPPLLASEINSGGFLERRLRMIISEQPLRSTSRWIVALVVLLGAGLLPLGVAHAADSDPAAEVETVRRIRPSKTTSRGWASPVSGSRRSLRTCRRAASPTSKWRARSAPCCG